MDAGCVPGVVIEELLNVPLSVSCDAVAEI